MAQTTPTQKQIQSAILAAVAAVAHAQSTRKRYRRRRLKLRDKNLAAARDRCAEAAIPLRSWLGMVAWHNLPIEEELEMKKVMSELRYERRQINKMLG